MEEKISGQYQEYKKMKNKEAAQKSRKNQKKNFDFMKNAKKVLEEI